MKTSKDELDRASEIVYEAITGKCWHKCRPNTDASNNPYWCHKCNERWLCPMPPLATSLDAWAEHIWPVMTEEQWVGYDSAIEQVANVEGDFLWALTPLHHLEAALRMLNKWETWKAETKGRD